MIVPYVLTACGAVMFCVFLRERVKKGACASVAVLKSIVSLLFIFTAITASVIEGKTVYGLLILSGLILGMLGDIWLDLKYAHPESEKVYTCAGFAVFGIGHIFYAAAMITFFYIRGNIKFIISPLAVSVIAAVLNIFGEDVMKIKYGQYKAIAIIYTVFVFSLPALAISFAIQNSFKCVPVNMMAVAGLFFLVSDFILSGTYFGEGKNRPVDVITNHATYYIAQFIIALSICFVK
ncbi:MAG: hypothetical protein II702_06365 [Clostridia bacterium]|nr:hypothetical protein [Clostridia bacterium]